MEVLAKRLKWLREKERYAQKDIAKKIGMTQSGYQKIEYGERDPKLDVLVTLCDIFNVSADFLIGRNSSIKELNSILETLKGYQERIHNYKAQSTYTLRVISELRKRMKESAENLGYTDELTIRFSRELDEKLAEQNMIFKKIDDMECVRKDIILHYIKEFLDIPESKPFEDSLISRFMPYRITIQMNIYEEFDLLLFGDVIGALGQIESYKTEEESVKAEEALLKRLNSRN
jgi:transcriptional regulator with XRE-family HTH domain